MSSETRPRYPIDEAYANNYELGRSMDPSEVSVWTSRLSVAIGPLAGPILDLGCGTGRLSDSIAADCSRMVIGVEPSDAMLKVARRRPKNSMVTFKQGAAERIPLLDSSVAGALAFLSLHHFQDLGASMRELRRVCLSGAAIMIRTEFSDRPSLTYWHALLPEAGEIDRSIYPKYSELTDAANAAGLRVEAVERVPFLASNTLAAYLERMRLGAMSALQLHGRPTTAFDPTRFDEPELTAPVWEVGHVVTLRAP